MKSKKNKVMKKLGAELSKEQDGPETLVVDKDGEGTAKPDEVTSTASTATELKISNIPPLT
jgi:hypothetical protein